MEDFKPLYRTIILGTIAFLIVTVLMGGINVTFEATNANATPEQSEDRLVEEYSCVIHGRSVWVLHDNVRHNTIYMTPEGIAAVKD